MGLEKLSQPRTRSPRKELRYLFASMAEKQLTFRENDIAQILNRVYLSFKEGAFAGAIELLEKALAIDFEYQDVTNALKCANFWHECLLRVSAIAGDYEKGEHYLNQWKLFSGMVARMREPSERCLFTLKYFVFGRALEHYLALLSEGDVGDPEILLRIGRCHKCRGSYENAQRFLELASQVKRNDGAILAELADCYALVNEDRAAKAFFREAFFLDPGGVELSYLESPLILRLIERLRERFGDTDVREWIPIYGNIYGLFNVKRELRPLELGRLKQTIHQLEREAEDGSSRRQPRLINHYLWLIDHYLSSGEERARVEEILARIRELDPEVFAEYTN
jgi:tetratricopeptide (TPR) repeat protein